MKKGTYFLILFFILASESSVWSDSLFRAKKAITASIFSDRRARNVGDIITVLISESTSSAQSGSTEVSKKSSLVANLQNFLFPTAAAVTSSTDALFQNAPYVGSRLLSHKGTMPKSDWSSNADFEGEGELSHNESIQGKLTASIIEVLPNGNFIIEGKRSLFVDKQKRIITLSGVVRPEDIGADNTVMSQYIAEAKIHFDGSGPLTDSRKRGLLGKLWDFIGPY